MQHLRDDGGAYWTGLQVDHAVRWPAERSTWTAAAVVLAVDALSGSSGGAGIFRDAGAGSLSEEVDLIACGCEPSPDASADPVADALEHS